MEGVKERKREFRWGSDVDVLLGEEEEEEEGAHMRNRVNYI